MKRAKLDLRLSRHVTSAAILVALLVHPRIVRSDPPPSIVYVSPVPGARYVRPGTNVIVRAGADLEPVSPSLLGAITVTGSRSGPHPGRTRLSDDGRTLLLRPDVAFAWGESVTVTLDPRARLDPGVLGERGQFTFTIARSAVPAAGAAGSGFGDPLARWLGEAPPPTRPSAADTVPLGFPAIRTTIYGTPAPGRLFLSNLQFSGGGTSYLLILDDSGAPFFYRAMPAGCTDFKVQPDGRLSYFDTQAGEYFLMDDSYTIVDHFGCGNGYQTDLHELRMLPNGHALLLGDDPETVDMSEVVPGGNPSALVFGLIIQELDVARDVVFEWRSWDHFAITDATHEDLTAPTVDYVHGNALEPDNDGNLILSSRHLDEITKVDHTTGDILWRWGGKHNEFTFLDDTLHFSHQHAIRRTPTGTFTLFDNGNYRDPPFSRAVEYQVDESARTARLVWQFRNTPDTYASAMGYVQRLANGSTLIGWGVGKPDVIEVAADGSKVMELSLPALQASYRATRVDWKPDQVSPIPESPAAVSLSPNAPNPFRSVTELFLSLAEAGPVSVGVFDIAGRRVLNALDGKYQEVGVYRIRIDLSGLPAGVYLCRAATPAGVQTRRIVHVR